MTGPGSKRARVRLGPGGARPQQVEARKQDAGPYAVKNRCPAHLIEYYTVVGDPVRCPMCTLEGSYEKVRTELAACKNELKVATGQLRRLQVQLDLQSAIRTAIQVLDDNDFAWLKVQMYQYKTDKSVMLKPTHGRVVGGARFKRGEKLPPNGFMTVPKRGDPEAHAATSLGGLAMAEYLDEAITCFGSAQAMGVMLKAWWTALPGART